MEMSEGELRRIQLGLTDEERNERPFVVRVFFAADDPVAVIGRARDVLARVIERVGAWPAEESWPDLLPSWFVERCAPERTADPSWDPAAWLARWQAMTPEEKAEGSKGPWQLSNWLYYFDPTEGEGEGDDRSWWWWDAGTDEPGEGWIEVATTGWPFGTGSLYWLIEASGGTDTH